MWVLLAVMDRGDVTVNLSVCLLTNRKFIKQISSVKKILYTSMAVVTVFFIAACSSQEETPTPTPTEAIQPVSLVVSGSGSVTGVLAAIADEFEAANPGYLLQVLSGSGTGGGVTGAIDGTFDLAAMSRPAHDSEAEQGIEFMQFGTSPTAILGIVKE